MKLQIFITKENFNYCKQINPSLFAIIEKYKINSHTKKITVTEEQAELFYYFFGTHNIEKFNN